ncbi:MAG: Hint domain-containing protein [Paracoccaceae bacterium]|jgi:hypothetical protein
MPLTRSYEVAGLAPAGEVVNLTRNAPATPAFEDAFAGFARGTLIQTANGPVAVEDLVPGMPIAVDGEDLPLLWIGSMTLDPERPGQRDENSRLTRITADTFGLGRPMPDLLLGARARLLFHHAQCEALLGQRAAFAPARGFIDGMSAFQIAPATPVRVYHLALERQAVLRANGVEVESFHPGLAVEKMLDRDTLTELVALFPHARGLGDFGPMPYPRLTAFELEGMRAA